MIGSRFAILMYADVSGLINASKDRDGRPGSWQMIGIPEETTIASIVTLPLSDEERERYPDAFRLLITYNVAEPPPAHLLRDRENERSGYLIRIEAGGPEGGSGTPLFLSCGGCGAYVEISGAINGVVSPSFEEVADAVELHRQQVHE